MWRGCFVSFLSLVKNLFVMKVGSFCFNNFDGKKYEVIGALYNMYLRKCKGYRNAARFGVQKGNLFWQKGD